MTKVILRWNPKRLKSERGDSLLCFASCSVFTTYFSSNAWLQLPPPHVWLWMTQRRDMEGFWLHLNLQGSLHLFHSPVYSTPQISSSIFQSYRFIFFVKAENRSKIDSGLQIYNDNGESEIRVIWKLQLIVFKYQPCLLRFGEDGHQRQGNLSIKSKRWNTSGIVEIKWKHLTSINEILNHWTKWKDLEKRFSGPCLVSTQAP